MLPSWAKDGRKVDDMRAAASAADNAGRARAGGWEGAGAGCGELSPLFQLRGGKDFENRGIFSAF